MVELEKNLKANKKNYQTATLGMRLKRLTSRKELTRKKWKKTKL